MKLESRFTYRLTEEDARRLHQLSLTLSRAIAELLEARCQESLGYITEEEAADYDLHELSVYEQAHNLNHTHFNHES